MFSFLFEFSCFYPVLKKWDFFAKQVMGKIRTGFLLILKLFDVLLNILKDQYSFIAHYLIQLDHVFHGDVWNLHILFS